MVFESSVSRQEIDHIVAEVPGAVHKLHIDEQHQWVFPPIAAYLSWYESTGTLMIQGRDQQILIPVILDLLDQIEKQRGEVRALAVAAMAKIIGGKPAASRKKKADTWQDNAAKPPVAKAKTNKPRSKPSSKSGSRRKKAETLRDNAAKPPVAKTKTTKSSSKPFSKLGRAPRKVEKQSDPITF